MVEQGGLGNGSPPSGVQGQGCSGGLGSKSPEAIGTMKYCAYKNWFLCFICLYVIAKTYTEIEKDIQLCNRRAAMATLEMMYPARGVWIEVI